MFVKPIKTKVFQEGEDLFIFIKRYIKKIPEKSVIVVTSKIVALAEKNTVINDGSVNKEDLIKSESEWALPTKYVWLTVKDGMLMASAGIDESNADGRFILLPKDSFKSASILRKKLMAHYKLKSLGILITDSRTMPLRSGITGVALGYVGFKGIKDYIGQKDIYGRKFKFSRVDMADSLAAAAVLTMGEGSECQPLAIINQAPIEFCDRVNRNELKIDIQDDMYKPFFVNL